MNVESFLPFLLILAPFVIAFTLEALVLYFLQLKQFWRSIGLSFLVNIISLVFIYLSYLLLEALGYSFNGLQLPLQVVMFLWWISIISDGIFLSLFNRQKKQSAMFATAVAMNSLSYLFLYFFITNSH